MVPMNQVQRLAELSNVQICKLQLIVLLLLTLIISHLHLAIGVVRPVQKLQMQIFKPL
jgi:hypothetical protein